MPAEAELRWRSPNHPVKSWSSDKNLWQRHLCDVGFSAVRIGAVPTDTPNAAFMSATLEPADSSIDFVAAQALRAHENACDLLSTWQDSASIRVSNPKPQANLGHENQLAVVRLGMASSLFFALRAKHAATAAKSLRVAISVSAWCERMGVDADFRDRIEVAALLHDIGKIGMPDRILRKPGKLEPDERMTFDLAPRISVEILRGCTSDQELLDIIAYRNQWYDSRREQDGPVGEHIPLGARMLAIAGAFDAMMTDTVYRSAMPREKAIGELFRCAGSQFDPILTDDFARMLEDNPAATASGVAQRWLHRLQERTQDSLWNDVVASGPMTANAAALSGTDELLQHWLDQADDGVVFTDTEGVIVRFNRRMTMLTGIDAAAVIGQRFDANVFGLIPADRGNRSNPNLIEQTIRESSLTSKMIIHSAARGSVPVEVQTSSIQSAGFYNRGVLMLVRDLSEEVTIQEELDSLHKKSVTDPLTKVSNRAHFDQTLEEMLEMGAKRKTTLSLVICDIDHFKKVNDVHGHQAGDEALVSFAKVLQSHAREGDLVARYGGEEFLLLAPACDIAAMTRRAEGIRAALAKTPLPSLNNESVTASFGVTEMQSGDSAESIVARADRALLKAKDSGRNRVIQLGSGNSFEAVTSEQKSSWLQWWQSSDSPKDEFDIITPVPVDLAIEKLRGFISDHNAHILAVDEAQVTLQLQIKVGRIGRRVADTQIQVRASLTLSQRASQGAARGVVKTNVHVLLEPIRNRDRRGEATKIAFQKLTDSLRSYLMGEKIEETP